MTKGFIFAGVLVAGLLAGCLDQDGQGKKTLFRSHFAGPAGLGAATNATRLRTVAALPQTAELRADVSRKLAKSVFEVWRKELPPGTAGETALLQPLFEDLMRVENLVEMRGSIGKTETAIAIELSDERAQLWSTNLWQVATAWKFSTPREVTLDGAKGWEAKRNPSAGTLQFLRAGKWVVTGLAPTPLDSIGQMLRQIAQSGRALPALTNGFWDVQADLPRLKERFPTLAHFPMPPAHFTLVGRGENVRTELKLELPEKATAPLDPWRIPTNIVGEPLTSFTVARGIAPMLERVPGFSTLGLNPMPHQITTWGVSNPQCRVYFALPVPSSTNAMEQLAPNAPGFMLKRFPTALGDFLYASNRHELMWGGLPWILPNVRTVTDAGSEFLIGGIFPLTGKTIRAPDELYAQIRDRANLVYYDWEDTPQRLDHGRQLYQLACLVDQRPIPHAQSVAQRWLVAILPSLANSVTEITRTGPQELTLVRKSQIGFTGFELATFAAWLDSPGFPFRLELPPPSTRRATNAPSPARKP